jgi:hypothetical protein
LGDLQGKLNDEEKEEEKDGNGDEFEEDDIDVSDNEILDDKDGNVITEEDVGEGLKQIMERYMTHEQASEET